MVKIANGSERLGERDGSCARLAAPTRQLSCHVIHLRAAAANFEEDQDFPVLLERKSPLEGLIDRYSLLEKDQRVFAQF